MDLKEIQKLLWENKFLIITIPIISAVLVYIFATFQPEKYTSNVVIYTGLTSSNSNVESGIINFPQVNNDIENVITLLQSGPSKEDILLRVLAIHIYDHHSDGQKIPESHFDGMEDFFVKKQHERFFHPKGYDSIYNKLRKAIVKKDSILKNLIFDKSSPYFIGQMDELKIRRGSSSDILNITFTSTNDLFCQQILEQSMVVLENKFELITSSENDSVVEYFRQKLKEVEEELNITENLLINFKNRYQIINFEEQTKILVYDRQTAFGEVELAKMNMLAAEKNLVEIESKLNKNNNFFTTNATLIESKEALASLIKAIAKDTMTLANDNIVEKQSQIVSLKGKIQSAMTATYRAENSEEGISTDVLLASWLERFIIFNSQQVYYKNLQENLEKLNQQIKDFSPLETNLKKLMREIELKESQYIEVLRAYQRSVLKQENERSANNLLLIDSSEYTTIKDATSKVFLSFVGFIFGVFVAISVLFAKWYLKNNSWMSSLE